MKLILVGLFCALLVGDATFYFVVDETCWQRTHAYKLPGGGFVAYWECR